MRKIVVGAMMSLDGVMQAPGGPNEDPVGGFRYGGWVAPFFDPVLGEAVGAMFAQPFDLLLGRKTYDIFAAHWPYVGADDPIGPLFDRITKYVATRNSNLQLDWQNSRSLGTDVVGAVSALKKAEGPDLSSPRDRPSCCTLCSNTTWSMRSVSRSFQWYWEPASACS